VIHDDASRDVVRSTDRIVGQVALRKLLLNAVARLAAFGCHGEERAASFDLGWDRRVDLGLVRRRLDNRGRLCREPPEDGRRQRQNG